MFPHWNILPFLLYLTQTFARPHNLQSDDDLVIAVKSSAKFHKERLSDLAETWISLAKRETFVFTDADDPITNRTFNGHLINTHCGSEHARSDLSCKMNAELEFFVEKNARWSCHFDDDNYVNVPGLKSFLSSMDHRKDYYLGKQSMSEPISLDSPEATTFRFATGGAGICLSRSLVRKITPYISNQGFMKLSRHIMMPDDVTLGYLIEHLIGVPVNEVSSFHSHLENLDMINIGNLHEQISLSGLHELSDYRDNLVKIPSKMKDTLKFKAIHCALFQMSCQ